MSKKSKELVERVCQKDVHAMKPTQIQNQIFLIRGQKVMLSNHLAKLYGVETRSLIQAIKRNKERFPHDFMFQLSWSEGKNLRSQFVILEQGRYSKYRPYAFTEHGIAPAAQCLGCSPARI